MDCRFVGILYLFLGTTSGLLGFGFSTLMRLELLLPYSVLGDGIYYINLTSQAVLMVFFFLTVMATGFFNFLVPGFIGSPDFYFPRINFLSFLIIICSFIFLLFSLLLGDGVSTGWTMYPPLSSRVYSFSNSIDLFIISVHCFTISSLMSSVNLMCTVISFKSRAIGWMELSVFVWSGIVTSILNIFSLPFFSSALTMLFMDRNFNTVFFNPGLGGDPLLFQSLFWFWGQPEVYILIVPVFGIISMIVSYLLNREYIFGHFCMVVSIISVGLLGFLVWGHHMVVVGWSIDTKSFFMAATVVISLPTGLKVFNWICSFYFYNLKTCLLKSPFYYIIAFICYFIVGGVTGIMLSNFSLDVILQDTYFVVGHFHYVLSLAAVMGYFCGVVHCWPIFTTGLKLDFNLLIYFLFIFFLSSNLTFFPFHFIGLTGCPRRVSCYSDGYFGWFFVSSIGFVGLFISVILFFFIILVSINKRE